MAFQIKDFASIAASSINWMRAVTTKVTDFNIGSVVRTMLEAVAIELEQLYQQMFIGLKEAIPVSVYNSFSFPALPALPAGGMVRVTIVAQATDTVIPAGTLFQVTGSSTLYASTNDLTITTGNTYGDVPVAATTPGKAGNLAASTSFAPIPQPPGFTSALALASFINGQDAESDDARKIRFAAYVQALSRGTVAAIAYGLKTVQLTDTAGNITERVAYASVVEPWIADNTQPIGLINCYIHNGVGSTSGALLTKANDIIYGYYDAAGNPVPGWKAAGTKVVIAAATESTLAVTATLTALTGYVKADLITAVTAALQDYINTLDIGVAAIKSKMIEIAMDTPGVYNFVISSPAGDTTPASNVKLLPGTFTIT